MPRRAGVTTRVVSAAVSSLWACRVCHPSGRSGTANVARPTSRPSTSRGSTHTSRCATSTTSPSSVRTCTCTAVPCGTCTGKVRSSPCDHQDGWQHAPPRLVRQIREDGVDLRLGARGHAQRGQDPAQRVVARVVVLLVPPHIRGGDPELLGQFPQLHRRCHDTRSCQVADHSADPATSVADGGAEVGEHGQDAVVAVGFGGRPSLSKTARTCAPTVRSPRDRAAPIARSERPSTRRVRTSRSRGTVRRGPPGRGAAARPTGRPRRDRSPFRPPRRGAASRGTRRCRRGGP